MNEQFTNEEMNVEEMNTEHTMDIDPGMTTAKETPTVDKITTDLVNGISMSSTFDVNELKVIAKNPDELAKVVFDLKQYIFDVLSTPEENINERIDELMRIVNDFHEQSGMQNIEYQLRPGISDLEVVLLKAFNLIIMFTDLLHFAEMYELKEEMQRLHAKALDNSMAVEALKHDLTAFAETLSGDDSVTLGEGEVENYNVE